MMAVGSSGPGVSPGCTAERSPSAHTIAAAGSLPAVLCAGVTEWSRPDGSRGKETGSPSTQQGGPASPSPERPAHRIEFKQASGLELRRWEKPLDLQLQ